MESFCQLKINFASLDKIFILNSQIYKKKILLYISVVGDVPRDIFNVRNVHCLEEG